MTMHAWEKWHAWNAEVMKPITAWFLEAIRPAAGATLLDVACGTGIPSLSLAQSLGSGGRVVAVDSSPEMLDAARRIAANAGAAHIEHREMDMGALALGDQSFDGSSCAFGLMFAGDPQAAVGEMARVTKRGRPVAVAVWDEAARNPCLTTLFEPLSRFAPAPAEPGAPGPFRLGAPGALRGMLLSAGLGDVTLVSRPLEFEFESIERHWEIMSEMAAPLRAAAAMLPEPQLAALKAAIADQLKPFVSEGRVNLPGAALCAVGVRQ